MTKYLFVGGLVAAGFDSTDSYLLTISHSGRGLFSTKTWERVARDYTRAYPTDKFGVGIGPLDGQAIPITEIDYSADKLELTSHGGTIKLRYEDGAIEVIESKRS